MIYNRFKNIVYNQKEHIAISFRDFELSFQDLLFSIDQLANSLNLSKGEEAYVYTNNPLLNIVTFFCLDKLGVKYVNDISRNITVIVCYDRDELPNNFNIDELKVIELKGQLEHELTLNQKFSGKPKVVNEQFKLDFNSAAYENYVSWFFEKFDSSNDQEWAVEIYIGSFNEFRIILPLLAMGKSVSLFENTELKKILNDRNIGNLQVSAATFLKSNLKKTDLKQYLLFPDIYLSKAMNSIHRLESQNENFQGVHYLYGSLETAFVSSYRFVMPNELMTFNASNIGKVINKTGSLVFDNKMKLAPQGLVGNLYVAGLPVNG
ncbi:MAG: hypothetical protein ACJA2S_004957, partial [Cyclobacteriaceae bacterium]